MGSNIIFKERSMFKLNEKRNTLETAVPENINKMSSLTRFIPRIYNYLEIM